MKNEKPSAGGAKQTETQVRHRNLVRWSILSLAFGVITMVLLAMPFLVLADMRHFNMPTTYSVSGYDLVLAPHTPPSGQWDLSYPYSSYQLLRITGFGDSFVNVLIIAAAGIILISVGVGAALGSLANGFKSIESAISKKSRVLVFLSGLLMIFGGSLMLPGAISSVIESYSTQDSFMVLPGWGLLGELAVRVVACWRAHQGIQILQHPF